MEYVLNSHNKEEFPPAHTAEHLLNQVMIRMFGTERSNNAHIERKKSKMTFFLDHKPDRKEETTAQIGRFEMLGTNWDEQKRAFRVRFKVIPA